MAYKNGYNMNPQFALCPSFARAPNPRHYRGAMQLGQSSQLTLLLLLSWATPFLAATDCENTLKIGSTVQTGGYTLSCCTSDALSCRIQSTGGCNTTAHELWEYCLVVKGAKVCRMVSPANANVEPATLCSAWYGATGATFGVSLVSPVSAQGIVVPPLNAEVQSQVKKFWDTLSSSHAAVLCFSASSTHLPTGSGTDPNLNLPACAAGENMLKCLGMGENGLCTVYGAGTNGGVGESGQHYFANFVAATKSAQQSPTALQSPSSSVSLSHSSQSQSITGKVTMTAGVSASASRDTSLVSPATASRSEVNSPTDSGTLQHTPSTTSALSITRSHFTPLLIAVFIMAVVMILSAIATFFWMQRLKARSRATKSSVSRYVRHLAGPGVIDLSNVSMWNTLRRIRRDLPQANTSASNEFHACFGSTEKLHAKAIGEESADYVAQLPPYCP